MSTNIDEDPFLRKSCKRYYEYELELESLYFLLYSKGYEEEVIDRAVSDYYYAYIYPEIMAKYAIGISVVIGLILISCLIFG